MTPRIYGRLWGESVNMHKCKRLRASPSVLHLFKIFIYSNTDSGLQFRIECKWSMTHMPNIIPLKKSEQEKLLQAALKVPNYFDINVYETVVFFLDTGIHPCILAQKEARKLRYVEEEGKKHIEWYRPKKEGMNAYTSLPISKRLAPFVERFLFQQLPNYRQFYNNLLKEVKKVLKKAFPKEDWVDKVCPLALRHTFAVNRLDGGMSVLKLQQYMNCSRKTLEYYTKYRPDMLQEDTW